MIDVKQNIFDMKTFQNIKGLSDMTTLQEIEQAVARLPEPDLKNFISWFETFETKSWDGQIEKDAKSGRLNKLADNALIEFESGKCQEL